MTQKKKNNIIIGSLCAVVLLMVVGYAAFATQLNITGTGKITSNWNILITDIQTKNIVGGASNASEPTGKGTLTATLNTNLVSPGDSIEYDITVSNQGSINAVLSKINVTDSNNPAIKFTSSGLTEGDVLNAGGSAVLTVKVEYDSNITSQPENTEGTFTVTLDYVQNDGSGSNVPAVPDDNTFYGLPTNYINVGNSIDAVESTKDYTTLGKDYFIKYTVNDDAIESLEVCFIKDGIHCMKPNEYETSKTTLISVFGDSNCYTGTESMSCSLDGNMSAYAEISGTVYVDDLTGDCKVYSDRMARCSF